MKKETQAGAPTNKTGVAGKQVRDLLLSAASVSEHRITLAGVETSVLVGGDGPPMVLLHGPGHSSLWWLRVVPRLVQDYRVIVPDLPGHGASGLPSRPLDERLVLDWLDGLVDRMCAEPPVLVGHALGGSIALRYASKRPGRIDRVVAESSLGLGRFLPSPRFAFRLFRFLSRPSERRRERFFRHCMLDQDRVISEMGAQWGPFAAYYVDGVRDPARKRALQHLLKQVGLPRIPPKQLDRVRVPVALIHGRHDAAVKVRVAKSASERLGWPLYVLDEAGADPDFEDPVGFLDALGSALEADRTTAAGPKAEIVSSVH